MIELVAGVALFFAASHLPIFNDPTASDLALIRMYGAAALGLGLFCLKVWRAFDDLPIRSLFFAEMFLFNIGVAIASNAVFVSGLFTDMGAVCLHSLLAVLTAWFWWRKQQ